MKKSTKLTIAIVALFAAAAVLIGFGGVGVARAAANYQSNEYVAQVQMKEVGVTLSENGTVIDDGGELLTNLIPAEEKFQTNKAYSEVLTFANAGTINEYIRVVVDIFWMNADGTKNTELQPSMIGMGLNEGNDWVSDLEGAGWIVDPASSYLNGGEQMILYYSQPVAPGDSTPAISNFLKIDGKVATAVEQTSADGVVTTTYKYDGVKFGITAEADAVQTHNAQDAILSAWGVSVNAAEDGTLTLN